MITMKRTGVTNPARAGFVAVTSSSNELGDYLRKINSLPSLDANESLELFKLSELDAAETSIACPELAACSADWFHVEIDEFGYVTWKNIWKETKGG